MRLKPQPIVRIHIVELLMPERGLSPVSLVGLGDVCNLASVGVLGHDLRVALNVGQLFKLALFYPFSDQMILLIQISQ